MAETDFARRAGHSLLAALDAVGTRRDADAGTAFCPAIGACAAVTWQAMTDYPAQRTNRIFCNDHAAGRALSGAGATGSWLLVHSGNGRLSSPPCSLSPYC